MEAVSREADLAKPRVYAAYPGVEPLLLALVERERGRAIAALTEAMPGFDDGADFDDILVAAATNLLQSVAANPESWRLLLLRPTELRMRCAKTSRMPRAFALAQLARAARVGT